MLLFKFLVVGGVNTLFYYLVYALFIYLNFRYPIAVFFATVVAMLFSFKTFGKFVFKKSDNRLLTKFILVTLINLLLNIALIYFFNKFGFNNYISGLFATLFVALNSFVLNKFFVFK